MDAPAYTVTSLPARQARLRITVKHLALRENAWTSLSARRVEGSGFRVQGGKAGAALDAAARDCRVLTART